MLKKKLAVVVIAVLVTAGGVVGLNGTEASAATSFKAADAFTCAKGETLVHGSRGRCVSVLQFMLKDAGYDVNVDGKFGDKTWRANFQYETKNRWNHDGKVGEGTFTQLGFDFMRNHPFGNKPLPE